MLEDLENSVKIHFSSFEIFTFSSLTIDRYAYMKILNPPKYHVITVDNADLDKVYHLEEKCTQTRHKSS